MSTSIELSNEVYERLAKQAQTRGITIAETIEQVLAEAETNRRNAVIEQMRAAGLLLPKQPMPPGTPAAFKPIEVSGRPVSEILIEERR